MESESRASPHPPVEDKTTTVAMSIRKMNKFLGPLQALNTYQQLLLSLGRLKNRGEFFKSFTYSSGKEILTNSWQMLLQLLNLIYLTLGGYYSDLSHYK